MYKVCFPTLTLGPESFPLANVGTVPDPVRGPVLGTGDGVGPFSPFKVRSPFNCLALPLFSLLFYYF